MPVEIRELIIRANMPEPTPDANAANPINANQTQPVSSSTLSKTVKAIIESEQRRKNER
ncbi:MAG: DUF5908 family protein [Saprospiraceae bacterium]